MDTCIDTGFTFANKALRLSVGCVVVTGMLLLICAIVLVNLAVRYAMCGKWTAPEYDIKAALLDSPVATEPVDAANAQRTSIHRY